MNKEKITWGHIQELHNAFQNAALQSPYDSELLQVALTMEQHDEKMKRLAAATGHDVEDIKNLYTAMGGDPGIFHPFFNMQMVALQARTKSQLLEYISQFRNATVKNHL